jgi:hypothetical protein
MGIKALRLYDIDVATLEWRRSRPQGSLLRKFRRFIEESTWDEDLLKCAKWADGVSLAVAVVSALYVFSVGIFLIR